LNGWKIFDFPLENSVIVVYQGASSLLNMQDVESLAPHQAPDEYLQHSQALSEESSHFITKLLLPQAAVLTWANFPVPQRQTRSGLEHLQGGVRAWEAEAGPVFTDPIHDDWEHWPAGGGMARSA
jgi:hypothetical protein